MVVVRNAEPADLEQVLIIADARRHGYARYQPRFWNPASDDVDRQRSHFRALLIEGGTLFAVAAEGAEIRGFVIATLVGSPPVYDPGGETCLVDDFAVRAADDWPRVGPLLLDRVRAWAAERDAVQLVVVTAQRDDAKRVALDASGLSVASEWWVGPVD